MQGLSELKNIIKLSIPLKNGSVVEKYKIKWFKINNQEMIKTNSELWLSKNSQEDTDQEIGLESIQKIFKKQIT